MLKLLEVVLNNIFQRIFLNRKKFLKDPRVMDSRGSSSVGLGKGMARTSDPFTQALLSLRAQQLKSRSENHAMYWGNFTAAAGRRIRKRKKERQPLSAILDLGSGDGVMRLG